MKKIIALFVAITSVSFAALGAAKEGTLEVGYRSKDFTFGKVSSTAGAYIADAGLKWESFRLDAKLQNNLTLNSSGLYQIDLLGGYTFFSTLADIEVGTKYVTKLEKNPADKTNHWRPFISVGKGWLKLTGTMDLESQTSNIEGRLAPTFGNIIKVTPGIYAGYTDVNDAFPRSRKEVKYTNAYFGGSVDLAWKFLYTGVYTLREGTTGKFTTGWRAGATVKL